MSTYTFEVEEILVRSIEVHAKSSNAAYEVVSQMYKNEDIVLSADDFSHVSIRESTSDNQDTITQEIIDYLYNDEKRHYEEDPQPDHIFLKLKKLKNLL